MDLLLTHGYFLYEDPKELQIMKPYVPLGILYLTSHLRACNFEVEVFDSTFSLAKELLRLLEVVEPAVLGVYAESHDAEQCAADSQGGEGGRVENRRRWP